MSIELKFEISGVVSYYLYQIEIKLKLQIFKMKLFKYRVHLARFLKFKI